MSTMKADYRVAEEKDTAGLKKIFPCWKNIKERLKQKNRIRYVAVVGGEIVGHIAVKLGSKPKKHIAKLESLSILPKFRRQGIGIGLEQFAIENLPHYVQLVTCSVNAENVASLELHKKIGFKEYGALEKGSFAEGKFSDCILLVKKLNG